MRRRKVVRFHRGPRRHPKWNLGTPTGERRKGLFSRAADPRVYLRGVIVVGAFLLVLLPMATDGVVAAKSGSNASGCRVISVTDGDTVRLFCAQRGVVAARLTRFDTPELFSAQCVSEFAVALRAKWTLRWVLMTSENVSFVREGTDQYGRALVFASADGIPVSRIMIARGLARSYSGGERSGWC